MAYYLIYDINTTKIFKKGYKTQAAARGAITRAVNAGLIDCQEQSDYGIAEHGFFYSHLEKSVERTNLQTGEKYWEPINTPVYMSPAFESYWSM